MQTFQIQLKDETIEKINELIALENLVNKYQDKNRPSINIEDFIKSSVVFSIKHMEGFGELINISGLNTDENNFNYKNRFKEIMKQKGMKQVELSKRTNIHSSNLSQILNNVNQPRLDYFLRLWIVLGCPPMHECIYQDD